MKSILIESSCKALVYGILSCNLMERYRAKELAQYLEKIAKEGSINVMGKTMLAICYFYQAKYEEFAAITEGIIQSN
jgi:hypothetical protein